MTQQQPSIGRVVHYTRRAGHAEPAIITGVNADGTVSLHVFGVHDDGRFHLVSFSEAPSATEAAIGKWSWPVFVPPK
jgi:hypothetical protein